MQGNYLYFQELTSQDRNMCNRKKIEDMNSKIIFSFKEA